MFCLKTSEAVCIGLSLLDVALLLRYDEPPCADPQAAVVWGGREGNPPLPD